MKRARTAVAVGLALALSCASALGQMHEVPAELWDRPRTGADVLGQESIRRAVNAALAQPEARIVIHHGMGQEALLHAEELRSWLAALAVEPRRVALRSDQPAGSALKIEVIP